MKKLQLDPLTADLSMSDQADLCAEAKNVRGTHKGFAPAQWLGKRSALAPAIPPSMFEASPFMQSELRKDVAAKAFIEADRQSLLRLVMHARSRVLKNPVAGDIVYYYRRHHKVGHKGTGTYFCPARVIVVEPPEGDSLTSSVVWVSHAGVLVRCAPEHLRAATPLEITIEHATSEASPPGVDVRRTLARRAGQPYIDLGDPPSPEELARDNLQGEALYPDSSPDVDMPHAAGSGLTSAQRDLLPPTGPAPPTASRAGWEEPTPAEGDVPMRSRSASEPASEPRRSSTSSSSMDTSTSSSASRTNHDTANDQQTQQAQAPPTE